MRIVIQRVSEASVNVDDSIVAFIGMGFLILVGITHEDTEKDAEWLAQKVAGLRVFADGNGLMNLNLQQVSGGVLSISQFTLHAQYKKGNRPSFIAAAKPEEALKLFQYFNQQLEKHISRTVHQGIFGADMKVSLVNDGPVTILMDSKNGE